MPSSAADFGPDRNTMPRPATALFVFSVLAGLPAQDSFQSFRAATEQRLRQHPFFSRVTFSLVERPPLLFCVERSANDDKEHDVAVANRHPNHLRAVAAQFEEQYAKPAGLVPRAEAGGYAIAVLSSAGRYVDFRTAIGEPSLAMARAHYTPREQIAVTYVDTFARHNTSGEERHALLHEFVHALQHAHAAKGNMPKPVWFNEGLADYRASSTHLVASLREPPMQENHVAALAFGYGNPAGKFFVAPIPDLVAATSYRDVVELAKKRNGGDIANETVLSMFYAQAEMFVRFLHEGEGGKYRTGFVAYAKAVQGGESGLKTFEGAFGLTGGDAIAALEQQWLKWLDGVLRRTYPTMRDLTSSADAPGDALPMPPPVPLDLAKLAWTKDDFSDRCAGVRRLCADGNYDAGGANPTQMSGPLQNAIASGDIVHRQFIP
jgi:hypothetical protein